MLPIICLFLLSLLIVLPIGYYYVLLLAGGLSCCFLSRSSKVFAFQANKKFVIAVAAHDEEAVIAQTVIRLSKQNYPNNLFKICVVADHCSDKTATLARDAGAMVYERQSEPRGSKGAALSWLFQEVGLSDFDAIVIFDADTRVDTDFLRWMNDRLFFGDKVIQGLHAISNPQAGWFPALTEVLFTIDNIFHNAGRDALGLSAKLMGDSVCFAREIFDNHSWGTSLTEDYQMRQRLILAGYRISYESRAVAYGEAPPTWQAAKVQRTRWMQGTQEVAKSFNRNLREQAFKRRSPTLIEAFLESILPSYSSYAVFILMSFTVSLAGYLSYGKSWAGFLGASSLGFVLLCAFPLLGLLLAKAPARSYMALFWGPYFIVWRTCMALQVKLGLKSARWVRTQHGAT